MACLHCNTNVLHIAEDFACDLNNGQDEAHEVLISRYINSQTSKWVESDRPSRKSTPATHVYLLERDPHPNDVQEVVVRW